MSKSGKKKKAPAARAGKKEKDVPEIEHVGILLRNRRQDRGLDLREVCEATRISVTNLKAIEEQDFSALPADTFTRGLLTIYAKFLDEDPERIVTRFLELREESQPQGRRIWTKQSASTLAPKRLAEPVHFSSISMAALLLLLITALFTGFCYYTSWNPFTFLFRENGEPDIAGPIVTEQVLPADTAVDAVREKPPRKQTPDD